MGWCREYSAVFHRLNFMGCDDIKSSLSALTGVVVWTVVAVVNVSKSHVLKGSKIEQRVSMLQKESSQWFIVQVMAPLINNFMGIFSLL